MDQLTEITKHLPSSAKVTFAIGAITASPLIQKMLGPIATEVGETLARWAKNESRSFELWRSIKLWEKV